MKLRYRIYLITLCALTGFALLYLGWAWQLKRRLVNLTAGCDRVVIEMAAVDHETRERSNRILEVKAQDKVSALAAAIDMWPTPLIRCRCRGDQRLTFYNGPSQVTTLAFAHGTQVKWPGVIGGEYRLTAASRAAIQQWFRSQGYETPQDTVWGGALIINAPTPP